MPAPPATSYVAGRNHNAAVGESESNFRAAVPDAVEELFGQVLALSEHPSGFPLAYRPEPRELTIEYRLPSVGVIPTARGCKYVKTRKEIDELPWPAKQIKDLYASVIHQVGGRKQATAGVLVTTAWVSRETKTFAARNNKMSIIEGGEFKHLLPEHLNLDVRIDLARRPRRATQTPSPGTKGQLRSLVAGRTLAAVVDSRRYRTTVASDSCLPIQ
jgi:hypothetical protein